MAVISIILDKEWRKFYTIIPRRLAPFYDAARHLFSGDCGSGATLSLCLADLLPHPRVMKYRRQSMTAFRLSFVFLFVSVSLIAQTDADPESREDRLVVAADQALDYGQYVEAIELLVRAYRRDSEEAHARLEELEAAMSLQPAASWLDASGQQIEGRLIDFEAAGGLDPAVQATINLGSGQAAVADLPVLFEAVRGDADLVSPVTTTDYGLANSRVLSVSDPYKSLLVRARVVFQIDDSSYAFEALTRDFSFQPIGRRASLAVVVVDGPEVRYQDRDTARIASALGGEGLSFVSPSRLPSPESLLGTSPGQGSAEDVTVVVIAEVVEAEQMTLGERAFDIWTSEVATEYRVLRTEDRRLLRHVVGPRETGQGSSRAQAVAGAIDAALGGLETDIERRPDAYGW